MWCDCFLIACGVFRCTIEPVSMAGFVFYGMGKLAFACFNLANLVNIITTSAFKPMILCFWASLISTLRTNNKY